MRADDEAGFYRTHSDLVQPAGFRAEKIRNAPREQCAQVMNRPSNVPRISRVNRHAIRISA